LVVMNDEKVTAQISKGSSCPSYVISSASLPRERLPQTFAMPGDSYEVKKRLGEPRPGGRLASPLRHQLSRTITRPPGTDLFLGGKWGDILIPNQTKTHWSTPPRSV
jgi:hypothetical protein